LPDHPQAQRWRSLGWRWFNRAILAQVASDGAYIQHSTNYHRLMLQTAFWVSYLAKSQGQTFPHETRERLRAATRWLLALLDPVSGRVPNLGPNDGAYILPLTFSPQDDYRPRCRLRPSFSGAAFCAGSRDEMGYGWVLNGSGTKI
jgi:hypothetical protein